MLLAFNGTTNDTIKILLSPSIHPFPKATTTSSTRGYSGLLGPHLQGGTLDKMPVHSLAHKHTVFKVWEEAREPEENPPRHRENSLTLRYLTFCLVVTCECVMWIRKTQVNLAVYRWIYLCLNISYFVTCWGTSISRLQLGIFKFIHSTTFQIITQSKSNPCISVTWIIQLKQNKPRQRDWPLKMEIIVSVLQSV